MKSIAIQLILFSACLSLVTCKPKKVDSGQYPGTVISNNEVQMKLYLPDQEKGFYRATRFDWSGVIASVQYKGHEYFGNWKETQDPLFHDGITGPVEGYIEPGLGYAEADPGGKFIRIGVGIIEKEEEPKYSYTKTYKILDHGKWNIDKGEDWIIFTHEIESDIGYGYIYTKAIKLKSNGFTMEHTLRNTGSKKIETDQFNHNFFVIDNERSGPAFTISFPFAISTDDDLKGYLEIKEKNLNFIKELDNASVFLELNGFSGDVADHQVTVLNRNSGAGITFSVDRPLSRMVFWACSTTICPENSIWISVEPGEEGKWTSDYSLFVE